MFAKLKMSSLRSKKLDLKVLLTFVYLCLSAQIVFAQQFNFRNFSVAEGLAQSQVYAMAEDSLGYLWFGTRGGGLSRFDGKTFQNYSVRDGLANNYVASLTIAQNGDLLIGTSAGLSIYDGSKFTNLPLTTERPIAVSAIHSAADGTIWLGTGEGIFHYRDSSFHHFSKIKKLPLTSTTVFFEDSSKILWAGGDFGLLKITAADNIKHYKTNHNRLDAKAVTSITEDETARIWVGIYGGGVHIFEGEKRNYLNTKNGLSSNRVTTLFKDKKSQIQIGTQDAGISIYQVRDSSFIYLREADGLPNSHIRDIMRDSWGNIWIGTSGGGVSRYSGQQFAHFDKTNGLVGNYVYAIEKDTAGHLWMSASRRGVTRYDGTSFTHYGREAGFTEMKTKAILADTRGRIWIGTEGRGVAVYDTTGFHFFEGADGIGGSWIRALAEDKNGNIWIGTGGGGITKVSAAANDSTGLQFIFKNFRVRDGLADRRINDLHIDRKGRVWYATRGSGIGFIAPDDSIHNLAQAEGLPYLNIRSLAEDSTGVLWLGSAGHGVLKLPIYADSFHFKKLLPTPSLTSDNIYLIGLDKAQNLYIGTEVGIDKIELDAERNFKTIKHFGQAEGFTGIETCQNAVLCDDKGDLWFGTINGLTKYTPGRERNNPIAPKIHLTKTRLFYEALSETKYANWLQKDGSLREGLQLPYQENNLGFEFFGINQSNPDKVRYQWQLEGLESSPSPLSKNTNATYANLAPGNYTFKVWAENEDGILSSRPAETHFSILKPYWQELWFILSCTGAVLLIIALIFRNRLNYIRKREAAERERLSMENKLLQLEQKALQLQMNPHFIFNALASIQSLIGKQDHKTARYYLAKFGKLMRAILENSRSTKITLNEEIELLENYLTLERFSRGESFDFSINTDENIDEEEVEIPPMLLQPFVENAIIHGVANSSKKGMIKIHFSSLNNRIKCTIEDNGIGRAQAQSLKKHKLHKSVALEVTQERLKMLHPDKRSFQIEDLEQGTRVSLFV